MRIISCHIENFGKLQNRTFDLQPGLNTICAENGWGKSTFAAFIKAMFYGLEGDRKRNIVENERKKYKPWQGGTFGGDLVFETKGKTYRITRIFHEKEADDEFELRDENTNLISKDFDSNIGEELFQIDRTSFVRTVFIGQNGCETGMTDGINAKIGNLTDNTDDINNYETAVKNITDMLNKLSATRATGSVSKRKGEINDLKVKIAAGDGIGESMERCRKLLETDEEEKEKLKSEIKKQQELQKTVSSMQAALGRKREWEKLREREKTAAENVGRLRGKFPGDVPEKEEVDAAIKNCGNMEQRKRSAAGFRLSDIEEKQYALLENYFGGSVPDEQELAAVTEMVSDYSGWKKTSDRERLTAEEEEELNRLEKEFAGDPYDASKIIGKWNERSSRKNALPSTEAALGAMRSAMYAQQTKKSAVSPLVIIGLILIAAGAVSFAFLPIPAAAVIAAVGVIVVIAGIMQNKKAPKAQPLSSKPEALQKKLEEDRAFIAGTDAEVKSYIEKHGRAFDENTAPAVLQEIMMNSLEYERLKKKSEKAEKPASDDRFEKERIQIRNFLKRYGINKAEDACSNELYTLKDNAGTYKRLREKKAHFAAEMDEYKEYSKLAAYFYKKYAYVPDQDPIGQLSVIRDNVSAYENACTIYAEAKRELKSFEEKNDTSAPAFLREDASLPSLDEVNTALLQLNDRRESLHSEIVNYNKELEALQEKYDEWEENKSRLLLLKEEQKAEEEKSRALNAVKGYLTAAKETITLKYAKPLLEQFKKYYSMMDTSRTDSFRIDANTNITLSECGKQRDTDTQSTGCQDLIAICLRAALVDAMYRSESPTVVMDDPFTNLDDEKVEKAKLFLEEFAEKYQIIYFTCSNARK